MTLTERIEAALKEPKESIDNDTCNQLKVLALEMGGDINTLLKTLLLERKALLAKVERLQLEALPFLETIENQKTALNQKYLHDYNPKRICSRCGGHDDNCYICKDIKHPLEELIELRKQVEAERWRDAEKEKPEKCGAYLIAEHGETFIAKFDQRGKWYSYDEYGHHQSHTPTHWKPINLP